MYNNRNIHDIGVGGSNTGQMKWHEKPEIIQEILYDSLQKDSTRNQSKEIIQQLKK